MSEDEKKYSSEWGKISESRVIEPFRTASESLDDCEFRYNPAHEFHAGSVPYLEVTPFELEDFTPEFLFKINKEELESNSGRRADELKVHIIKEDPSLHFRKMIKSWLLSELPDQFAIPASDFEELSGANGLSFGITISPKRGIKFDEDLANSPGHVIAQKYFHLGPEPISGSGFPQDYRDPENFQEGIDKNAFWYIEWISFDKITDPEAEMSEVLRVVFNKKCTDKIVNIGKNDSAGQVFWLENLVGIYLEFAIVVLNADVEEPNQNDQGFYPQILRTLEKITKRSFQELKRDFTVNNPSAISQLRSSLHAFFDTSKKIQSLKFVK